MDDRNRLQEQADRIGYARLDTFEHTAKAFFAMFAAGYVFAIVFGVDLPDLDREMRVFLGAAICSAPVAIFCMWRNRKRTALIRGWQEQARNQG